MLWKSDASKASKPQDSAPAEGMRRVIGQKRLDELELIGNHLFTVGVPVTADPEFKAYVFAAALTHSWNNVSVDNVLRRHRDRLIQNFSPPKDPLTSASSILQDVVGAAISRVNELVHLKLDSACIGLEFAINHLIRLESTFRGASQLIRLGFAFEAEAVIRLGYEQVGWSFRIATMESRVEIEKVSVTKAASHLAAVLPEAGRIYGILSNLAHMHPSTHRRFLSENEGSSVSISIELDKPLLQTLRLLLELLDAFLVVSEVRFGEFGLCGHSLNAEGTALHADRPAVRLLSQLESMSDDIEPAPAGSAGQK